MELEFLDGLPYSILLGLFQFFTTMMTEAIDIITMVPFVIATDRFTSAHCSNSRTRLHTYCPVDLDCSCNSVSVQVINTILTSILKMIDCNRVGYTSFVVIELSSSFIHQKRGNRSNLL